MADMYRHDELKRIWLMPAGFYRLQVSADGNDGEYGASRHINISGDELGAIFLMLRDNDNPEQTDADVEHPFPVVEVTRRDNPTMTRLPITSGEHIKRLSEMAEAGHVYLPRLAAWWSYCAGETDERPS